MQRQSERPPRHPGDRDIHLFAGTLLARGISAQVVLDERNIDLVRELVDHSMVLYGPGRDPVSKVRVFVDLLTAQVTSDTINGSRRQS